MSFPVPSSCLFPQIQTGPNPTVFHIQMDRVKAIHAVFPLVRGGNGIPSGSIYKCHFPQSTLCRSARTTTNNGDRHIEKSNVQKQWIIYDTNGNGNTPRKTGS